MSSAIRDGLEHCVNDASIAEATGEAPMAGLRGKPPASTALGVAGVLATEPKGSAST